eukprot:853060-Rhodomonas_salina.1
MLLRSIRYCTTLWSDSASGNDLRYAPTSALNWRPCICYRFLWYKAPTPIRRLLAPYGISLCYMPMVSACGTKPLPPTLYTMDVYAYVPRLFPYLLCYVTIAFPCGTSHPSPYDVCYIPMLDAYAMWLSHLAFYFAYQVSGTDLRYAATP